MSSKKKDDFDLLIDDIEGLKPEEKKERKNIWPNLDRWVRQSTNNSDEYYERLYYQRLYDRDIKREEVRRRTREHWNRYGSSRNAVHDAFDHLNRRYRKEIIECAECGTNIALFLEETRRPYEQTYNDDPFEKHMIFLDKEIFYCPICRKDYSIVDVKIKGMLIVKERIEYRERYL